MLGGNHIMSQDKVIFLNQKNTNNQQPQKVKRNKKLKKIILNKIIPSVIVSVISLFIGHYFAIKQIKYSYDFNIIDYEKDEYTQDELLEKAEKYYMIEQYLDSINIYSLDIMKTDPIAINNLAFMYEHGIFFCKNIELAKEIYFHAANLGNKTAIENYVIINLKNPNTISDLVEVLKYGYDNGSEIAYEFLEYFTYNDGNPVEKFWDLNIYTQFDILIQATEWEEISKDEYDELRHYSDSGEYSFAKVELIIGEIVLSTGSEHIPNYITGFYDTVPLSTSVECHMALYYKRCFINISNYTTNFIYLE